VPEGEVELFGIGERFRNRYPHLFSKKYNPDVYKFKYTKTQRAEASAKAFARGLIGEEDAELIQYPEALRADPILRFYKACHRWKEEVDKNPATYEERRKFENSDVFHQMIARVQDRLGIRRKLDLTDVEVMYLTCGFESAWNPSEGSPWCGMFGDEDFRILEYRQDLEYYWVDGYGHELTFKQACGPMVDILQQFKSRQKNTSPVTATAYFTHSGTLLKLISHLGLFNDSSPLTSESFPEHDMNRKWRTSFIDKFATNIAFVLFKCADEAERTTYRVGLLFQEEPIEAPFCDGQWTCPFEKVESYFLSSVTDCAANVQTMCKSRGKVIENDGVHRSDF